MPLFKVIRASAGSGKTFNLTHEYLRLLFAEQDAFMHILAVTFTNKATEEMKSRIIRELFALASDQPSKQLKGLIVSTGLQEKQIRGKATIILKKLLHNYSRFSINTIDSFFQRIIRSFTRELGIQEGYSIELDTALVLSEVIDRLLIKAEHDKPLLIWLTQFAESLIEKGENWNLRLGIRTLGNEIFKEEFKGLNEGCLKLFSDRSFLNQYRSELHALLRKLETTYKNFGSITITSLRKHGLIVDDFSMKSRGPAGFLVKLENGSFTKPTATAIQAATSEEKWYTAASPRKSEIIGIVTQELMPVMQQAIDYYNENHRRYHTAAVILKNLYTLGIMIDLSQLADLWCSENNTFLLPEAPVFLNKIIEGNDTPFIYEKAGCWYHHFMIDEFQDTSLMQWLNFKPLISNSLSQDYDNLAVGDTKQSIYRWRNSSWDILESRIGQDFLPGIIHSVTLKENWRSRLNIIQFNNHFFSAAAAGLQSEFERVLNENEIDAIEGIQAITELYRNIEQLPGDSSNEGGLVQVEYISPGEDTDFYDMVNPKLVDLLFHLQDHGYHLNDIAILTRKNSEATRLADFLLGYENKVDNGNHRLDVISDEALRLGSSIVVNTVIALLQHMLNPLDITNNHFLFAVCSNYIYNAEPEEKWINPGGFERSQPVKTGFIMPEDFNALVLSPGSFSLIEIVERLIKIFRLESHSGEQVYLMALRDLIIEYSRNHGSDISRFLEFWNETGREKSVSAPAGQDAVRILTLHKAKGLEFKITIIPYCTWELNTSNKTFLWCKADESPFNKVPVIPLSFTSQLQQTIFAEDFYKERYRQFVDNLNLLYVAFTRAQDALYVFCKAGENDQLKNVSDVSRKVLGNGNYMNGTLPVNISSAMPRKAEQIIQKPFSLRTIENRVKISFQGKLLIDPSMDKPSRPLNDGKILHEIFTMIRTRKDINTAVARLHIQGKIPDAEQKRFIIFIENAMNHLQVSTWFTDEWIILNEAEIILPNGPVKRPDRVMMREKQTVVIDYKFGSKMVTEYESQIKEYAHLLHDMGYENIEAYLWYVTLGRIVQVTHQR